MNYKIFVHLMPWEIDYALLWLNQLKKSSYYINSKEDTLKVELKLNLSSYLIDWENSKLPKEFFIDKFYQLENIIKDTYETNFSIYKGKKLYGHLDFQKEVIDKGTDFYINSHANMYFSEHLLPLMIECSKQIDNKYFVLIAEIHKMWDNSFNEITNSNYRDIYPKYWNQTDIYDIRANLKFGEKDIVLDKVRGHKWMGWFDLYDKGTYEVLCKIPNNWKGSGDWNWYSMMLLEVLKINGIDFQQHIVRNQIVFKYDVGSLLEGGFSNYYKKHISLKDTPNYKNIFKSKMNEHLTKGLKLLQEKGIS